jgi:radical SAM superfamily enzyme YgiQ (UPF0313 family)
LVRFGLSLLRLKEHVDCLFIFSPGGETQGSNFNYHLGSSYIISYLISKGFNARQFISNGPVGIKECLKMILDQNIRIAGFTVYDSNFIISASIAQQIRKISPGTLIIFGGPCPSVHSEFIMSRYKFLDGCFINESEESFLQFLSELSKNDYNYSRCNFSGINGISYRINGRVFYNPPNRKINNKSCDTNDLDKYPSPYLGGVIPAAEGYDTGILTARGCNQNCVYCNCSVLSNRRFSTHSIERVISELDFISKVNNHIKILTFQDDAFTLIPQRALKICRSIIDNKIKVRLGCITRCDCVDENLLDMMREAGFVSIAFSLESANPETLRRIGKVHVAEDTPTHSLDKEVMFIENFERMTAYAKKIGMENITASIMVGLPHETIRETKRTIKAIENNIYIDNYTHNYLKIFKGTPLFGNYKKYGYKIRYKNNNPLYPEIIYPSDIKGKVPVAPKSNLHASKEYNNKNTLKVLSLSYKESNPDSGFSSIILQADNVQKRFMNWIKDILSINGRIIHIYSGQDAMTRLADRNFEMFIKYLSPSLNIINYFLKEDSDGSYLYSTGPVSLKLGTGADNIRICDFGYFISNLDNEGINFKNTLCKEVNLQDSLSAISFLQDLSKKDDPFSFMTNLKPLPYFTNICKWTRSLANCEIRNTLIVNDRQEVRLCWYGNSIGKVGQTYEELIRSFESEKEEIMSRRRCNICERKDSCIKCNSPYPLSEQEYCKSIKHRDVSEVAGLMIGLDQIKQLFL